MTYCLHCYQDNSFFCILCRNSILLPKSGGKTIFGKILQMTLCIPRGCISHCFQDKCVFAFYAEIQYGRQKWRENHFWQKVADKFTHTPWVKNVVEIALSPTICEINGFLHFPSLQNSENSYYSLSYRGTPVKQVPSCRYRESS